MIPSDSKEESDLWRGVKVAVLAIGVTSVFAVVTIEAFQAWGSSGVEGISVVASAVLSTFLVLLYFRQSRILEAQYEVMKRSHQGIVNIDKPIIANGDRLEFDTKNTSTNVVQSIYLRTEITADTNVVIEPSEYQLRGIEDKKTTLEPLSDTHTLQGQVGGIIQSDNSVSGTTQSDHKKTLAEFERISMLLANEGVETCEIELSLLIDEPSGGYDSFLWGDTIEIEGSPMTFEEALPRKPLEGIVRKDTHESWEGIIERK